MRKLLGAILLVAAFAACSDNGPDTVTIDVDDDFFSPSQLTVDAGTTVTWTWVGERTHDVVFAGGTSASPAQANGTWSRTFDETGSYSYECTQHPDHNGEIAVR